MKKILGTLLLMVGFWVGPALAIPVSDAGTHALLGGVDATVAAGDAAIEATEATGWAADAANFVKQVGEWVEAKADRIKSLVLGSEMVTGGIRIWDAAKEQLSKLVGLRNAAKATLEHAMDMKAAVDRNGNPLEATAAKGDYLPDDYEDALKASHGLSDANVTKLTEQWPFMSEFKKVLDYLENKNDGTAEDQMQDISHQIALNRALAELAYRQGSDRMPVLKGYQNDIDSYIEDDKDTSDLQARIAAQQAVLQNELIRVTALTYLQHSQEAMELQRAKNRRLEAVTVKVSDIPAAVAAWAL